MALSIMGRLRSAWNVFSINDEKPNWSDLGASYSSRPDRVRMNFANERSIIASIYTRLSIDVSAIDLKHVRLDEKGQYSSDVDSGLNQCLTMRANTDQYSRAFKQDIAFTLFNNGCAVIVPVIASGDPRDPGGVIIRTLRVGQVVQWYPQHVLVNLYDERVGVRKDVLLDKSIVAIIENPLYAVMNEPNSTLQRLIRKLSLLDITDENTTSGKLNILIQLPYVVKSETRRSQAEQRRKDIEFQLTSSRYGIAYTDATEKVTQLNRPAENHFSEQIADLTKQLYVQLGLTEEIMNGTADENEQIVYYNRTIEPILAAIAQAMKGTFLTQTARTQGQSIEYFRDPFKSNSLATISDMADKFTRNEIMSSNEIRGKIGLPPSSDPRADELKNKNMPEDTGATTPAPGPNEQENNQNGS